MVASRRRARALAGRHLAHAAVGGQSIGCRAARMTSPSGSDDLRDRRRGAERRSAAARPGRPRPSRPTTCRGCSAGGLARRRGGDDHDLGRSSRSESSTPPRSSSRTTTKATTDGEHDGDRHGGRGEHAMRRRKRHGSARAGRSRRRAPCAAGAARRRPRSCAAGSRRRPRASSSRAEVVAPDAVEDLRARQHLARVAQEQLEQQELGAGQLDRRSPRRTSWERGSSARSAKRSISPLVRPPERRSSARRRASSSSSANGLTR